MSACEKKKQYVVAFPDSDHSPILLEEGSNLSRNLTAANSPLLFGCRAGICGTCLSEITDIHNGTLALPLAHEQDLLDVIAPGNAKARLACQINLTASISIKPLDEE